MAQSKMFVVFFCACALLSSMLCHHDDTSTSTYIEIFPGYRLLGHVMHKVTSSSIMTCVLKCSRTSGCLSVNVLENNDEFLCELNKYNRISKDAIFTSSSLYQYIEPVSNACLGLDKWHRIESHAFKYIDENLEMQAARQKCKHLSADLASIRNEKEQQFIMNTVIRGVVTENIYIGLTDLEKQGTFVWLDGTISSYRNWYTNEPNNAGGNEHCTFLWSSNGSWNDDPCYLKKPFICQTVCPSQGKLDR